MHLSDKPRCIAPKLLECGVAADMTPDGFLLDLLGGATVAMPLMNSHFIQPTDRDNPPFPNWPNLTGPSMFAASELPDDTAAFATAFWAMQPFGALDWVPTTDFVSQAGEETMPLLFDIVAKRPFRCHHADCANKGFKRREHLVRHSKV